MKSDYIKHNINNIINIQKIVTLHYFEFDRNFYFAGESHDFWEMVYVDKGVLQIKTSKSEFSLPQGECYFHKPNEFHIHKADGVTAPNVFVISFVCRSESMKFFKYKQIKVPAKIKTLISNIISEGQKTYELPFNNPDLKELRLLPDSIAGGQQMIRTYLEQFLIMLLRHETASAKNKIFASRDLMLENLANKMRQKLDTFAYKNITVEEFCAEMQYSKVYLSKVFMQNFGCTINEYINNVKISEAKRLIREREYNFTQISDMLCYSDPLYFSKVFRRVTGMSPSEYKKSVKKS